jgi:3-oxoacyl-[acyl-carrier protein] reductase
MMLTSSLKDKVVLVTGASKGIGKSIAHVFGRLGSKILLVARGAEDGERAAAEIRQSGGIAAFHVGDVSQLASMQRAAEVAVQQYGGLDILCANVGIFPSGALEELSEDQWDAVFDVNVKGTLFSVQACLRYLQKSAAGRIIVISSITGPITGLPGWSHYGATKAAQLGFIRTAAIELAKYNITINAVLPGNIATEGLQDLGEQYLNQMLAAIPLKRLGTTDDVGSAVAFLASPEAGFITGQTLVVDGGQVLPESLQALGG